MPLSSRAAVADGQGNFAIVTVKLADPAPDEIIVRMRAAGLCHTDYDSLSWGKPVVMGHEGAGVVHRVGAGVDDLAVGDAVILNWATPCLACFQCQEGNQHLCERNSPVVAGGNGYTPGHAHLAGTRLDGQPVERSFNLGTLSEYALVKRSAAVRMEDGAVPFPSAAIVSCGIMTGYGSVVNAARLRAGSSAVVLGCGGVGLSVIQGCRIAGAGRIVAIDVAERKLALARRFGATDTLLADRADAGLLQAARAVHELLGGRGADYAFECTAVPALGAAPLAMIRNAGVAVQASGIEQEITVDMRLFEWDKTYINPLYGQARPQTDFPRLLQLYRSGQLLLDEMVTRTYELDELQTAFDDMLSGHNAKGVVTFAA